MNFLVKNFNYDKCHIAHMTFVTPSLVGSFCQRIFIINSMNCVTRVEPYLAAHQGALDASLKCHR